MKPRYLDTGDPVLMPETGELVKSDRVTDYRLKIMADNSLLGLYNTESLYLIMLVRERIQREKFMPEVQNEEADEV